MDERIIKLFNSFMEIITEYCGKSAPVTVTFTSKGLIVKECPPIIIEALIKKGFLASMTEKGLYIDNLNL